MALKEILDVPDQFSLQSPLPPLNEIDDQAAVQNKVLPFGKEPENEEQRDVQLADILQAPSLEISLRTATEMDEHSDEAASLKRYDSNETNSVRKSPLEL